MQLDQVAFGQHVLAPDGLAVVDALAPDASELQLLRQVAVHALGQVLDGSAARDRERILEDGRLSRSLRENADHVKCLEDCLAKSLAGWFVGQLGRKHRQFARKRFAQQIEPHAGVLIARPSQHEPRADSKPAEVFLIEAGRLGQQRLPFFKLLQHGQSFVWSVIARPVKAQQHQIGRERT